MIFETFANRKRLANRGSEPDVYVYDNMPPQLRHQLAMIFVDGIGRYHVYSEFDFNRLAEANSIWVEIDDICRKELYSYMQLARGNNLGVRFCEYIINSTDIDDLISAIEVGCVALTTLGRTDPAERGGKQLADNALDEINRRFEQHSVGYQFESKMIIRVDSKFVHAEVMKPALKLLSQKIFLKANDEFLGAHKQYREGNYKDCVTGANRAFESSLKAICDVEGWRYAKGDRASELVTKVTNSGLFTHEFDNSLNSYVAMLKTGLPNVRNQAGGHGDGIAAAAVTAEIARFALSLTAANIVFLGESYLLLKRRR